MRVPRQRSPLASGALGLLSLLLCASPVSPAGGLSASGATELPAIKLGMPAPDVTYDEGNGPRKLSASRGAPVLVHFWGSWCDPCTEELPLFAQAQREEPGLAVVTFSDEEPGVAREYLKKNNLPLRVAEDPHHAVFRAYSVHDIPATIFVRTDGTVAYVAVGNMDPAEFERALALLNRPPAGPAADRP